MKTSELSPKKSAMKVRHDSNASPGPTQSTMIRTPPPQSPQSGRRQHSISDVSKYRHARMILVPATAKTKPQQIIVIGNQKAVQSI